MTSSRSDPSRTARAGVFWLEVSADRVTGGGGGGGGAAISSGSSPPPVVPPRRRPRQCRAQAPPAVTVDSASGGARDATRSGGHTAGGKALSAAVMSHTAVAAVLQVATFKWSRAGRAAAPPQGSRTLPVAAAAAARTPAATSAATPPTLLFDIALTGRATVASAPTAVAAPPTAAKNTCESGPVSCAEEVEAASDVVDRWPAAQPERQPTSMCGFQLQQRLGMDRLRRKLGLPPLRGARVRPVSARPVSLNLEEHIGR